jgi:hypothetical protein
MKGPDFLRQRVGKLKSRMGGVVPGSHAAMRGLDLHTAFRDARWMEIYIFGVTGRRFSSAQLTLIESIWTYTSYPDARIWNNRVAALAGTARSTGNLALAAALAVSEATVYGRWVDLRAIAFLENTLRAVNDGKQLSDCVRRELDIHRSIAGYGRPITSEDERIIPIVRKAHELGLDQGPHFRLAFEIDRYLVHARWRLRINYCAVASALLADMDVTPAQFYLCAFPIFLAGMPPCYIEAAKEPEGSLFPIPCEDIAYAGCEQRAWPESGETPCSSATVPRGGQANGG